MGNPVRPDQHPSPPPATTIDLGKHDKVTDSDGRTVENTANNGKITVTYAGTVDSGTPNENGGKNYVITGTISKAKMPAAGGSPSMTVNTNGKATAIELEKSGGVQSHDSASITGGNATVTVSGNYNDYTIDGTGNNVTATGMNNTGNATATSGGNYTNSGPLHNNNVFNTNGGMWQIH